MGGSRSYLEVFLTAGWIESFFSRTIWMGKTLWSSLGVGRMRAKGNGAHQRTGVECPLACNIRAGDARCVA